MEEPYQNTASPGSEEWHLARLGHVTASRFADVVTAPRSKAAKESGELSQTAMSYMLELIGEHLTGQPSDDLNTPAIRWGNQHEPLARLEYTFNCGQSVQPVGLTIKERLVAGTPDGLVGTDGIIEIKCPYATKNHIRSLIHGMHEDHLEQTQGNLWITGRQWCDFISFDPRLSDRKQRLVIQRSERDDKFIDDLSNRVLEFRDKLVRALERFMDFSV